MANKQYCFDIINPDNFDFNVEDLKKFVQQLYIGKKEEQFDKDTKIPFVTIYTKSDNNVCIKMTSRGKKNIEQVESINRKLKPRNLKWKNNISVSEPYEFDEEITAWWATSDTGLDGKRWDSLKQNGPYFKDLSEPYKPLGASLIYDGKKYKLTPEEEKIASFYAKRKISEASGGVVDEWTKDSVFNNNFWSGFKTYLTSEHKKIFKNFSKIEWGDLIAKIEADKIELNDQEKLEKKTRNEEIKRHYGYAFLDNIREKVGNFTIEPQAIFYGRGKNPNRGKIKKQIVPEDVTINIGLNDPIPTPPVGHTWGLIVHDQDSVWLARWTDSITNDTKYVMFSAEGRFKGEADLVKYEKARKLQMHITTVREKYMVDASSFNMIKKQLGTVLYLIDHFGVRVGNEKKEEEADTVGASTLRVDHVKLKAPNHVIFDFLGKDSIRFYKDLEVPKLIYDNFKELVKGKKGSDQVFDAISSRSINVYLKEFDKSFSAKVFRTRLASDIMYEAVKTVHIPEGATKSRTKTLFNKANAKVADVLNHTRNVSKKAQESVKKDKEDLKQVENDIKKAKKEGKSTTRLEKRKDTLNNKIERKTDVMAVAINTSLTNYIDPRLVVSWAKKEEADLTAIYTSTLIRKFKWAIETTDKSWNWMTSPLIGNPELEPVEGEGSAVIISEEDKPKKKSRKRRDTKSTKPKSTKPKSTKPKSTKPKSTKPKSTKPKEQNIGPGTVEDYKLLLQICEEPDKYKKQFYKIPKNVLKWIYPFSQYAIQKGVNVKANDYIVRFYERAYQSQKEPSPIHPQPEPTTEKSKTKESKTKESKIDKMPTKPLKVSEEYKMLTYMTTKELNEYITEKNLECKGKTKNELIKCIIDNKQKSPTMEDLFGPDDSPTRLSEGETAGEDDVQNCKQYYELCPENPNLCVHQSLPEDIKREACEATIGQPLRPNQILTMPFNLTEKIGRFTFSEYKPEFPVAHARDNNLGPIIPDSTVVDSKLIEYLVEKQEN
jgi:DNA topoisomerase-1